MINLLPTEYKRDIRAGRANRLLARYSLLTLLAILVLVIIMGLTWLLLSNIRQENQAKIDESEASTVSLANDIAEVNKFKSNLSVAKQILGQEVNYSAIILRYASAIPHGAIIDHIELDPSVVGTPSTFTARVKEANDAIVLKDTLNTSPYFDNAHFTEIQYDANEGGQYKRTVIMEVTINKQLLVDGEETQ